VCALIVLLVILGCESANVGRVYRVERDFSRAERMARRLEVRPDAVSDADRRRVADAFREVGDTYEETLGVADTTDTDRVRCVFASSRAHLIAAELYLDLGDYESARTIASRVRAYMAWSPTTAMVAQAHVVNALVGLGSVEEAFTAGWQLADEFPSVSARGEVYQPSFTAPMNTLALVRSAGDSVRARSTIDRALAFYRAVASAWPGKGPALLAEINEATLLEQLGNYADAAATFERILIRYPEAIMRPAEASAIALRLGQLYLRDTEHEDLGAGSLERSRHLDPKGPAACDATLTLAALRAQQGKYEQGLELYREALLLRPADPPRMATARFGRAQLLQKIGRWDEALAEYRALQAAYPHTPQGFEVPFVLAAHYRATSSEETAISTLRRASEDFRAIVREHPGTEEAFGAYRYLARAFVEQGDWNAAVDVMTEFAMSFPTAPEGAMALIEAAGVCRAQLRDVPRAEELLRRVKEGYPNTEFADAAARESAS